MNKLQEEINDWAAGKHKQWHVEAKKLKEYDGSSYSGWHWLTEQSWEFVAGFDYESDALEALKRIERDVREGEQYGGTQYEFSLRERKGA